MIQIIIETRITLQVTFEIICQAIVFFFIHIFFKSKFCYETDTNKQTILHFEFSLVFTIMNEEKKLEEVPVTSREAMNPTDAQNATSSDTEAEVEEEEVDDEDIVREAARKRLYAGLKPIPKTKKPIPVLPENQIMILKEHVRLMHGLSPRMKRKQKVICYTDSPEKVPRSNWTVKERDRCIRTYLKDRKDSEEDAFSSRCH